MTAAAAAAEAAAAEAEERPAGGGGGRDAATPPPYARRRCQNRLLFAFPPAYPAAVISVVASPAFRRVLASLALAAGSVGAPIYPALAGAVATDGQLMFTPLMYLRRSSSLL